MLNRTGILVVTILMVMAVTIGASEDQPESAEEQTGESTQASASDRILHDLFGSELVDVAGDSSSPSELEGKVLGLYFTAEWCPPCRSFTPILVEAYNELQEAGEPFEIVFVSADRTADDQQNYMHEYAMPWKAIPFDNPRRTELPAQYNVRGIPTLIILDTQGEIITNDGRNHITRQGADAFDAWTPERADR